MLFYGFEQLFADNSGTRSQGYADGAAGAA